MISDLTFSPPYVHLLDSKMLTPYLDDVLVAVLDNVKDSLEEPACLREEDRKKTSLRNHDSGHTDMERISEAADDAKL